MIIKLHDNKKINLEVVNARILTMKFDPKTAHVISKGDQIICIEFDGGFHIEVGDLFPLITECNTKTLYKVLKIEKLENTETYKIINEQINKSTHWLLPFVALCESEIGYDSILTNAYIYNDNPLFTFYKNGYIFLKYNYRQEYDSFFKQLESHTNFIKLSTLYSRYDYVYVFKIPEQWMKDVNLLLEGKYSQISNKAKLRILKFHSLKANGRTGNILYRSKSYMAELQEKYGVDFELPELENKFDKEQETLI